MFTFLRRWAKSNRSATPKNNPRRASLRLEWLEGRDVPTPVANIMTIQQAIEGEQDGLYRVTLSEPSSQWLTINLAFGGTAIRNVDYVTNPPVATIAPGALSADVVIDVTGAPMDDPVQEPVETIDCTLVPGAGFTVGPNNTSTLLLLDNDNIPPPNPVISRVVTTVQDVVNPNDDNVNYSLREAILAVNQAMVAATYKITFAANIQGQTITLNPDEGELFVLARPGVTGIRVTVDGSAMKMTVQRDRTATEKKHNIFGNSAGTSLTLANLNVHEGWSITEGGAVRSFGDLSVLNCDFRRNKATLQGGAIYFNGGTMVIANSECTFNSTEMYGGAISVGASAQFVSMVDTTVQWNRADFQGGGIFVQGSSTPMMTNLFLSHVTVQLNQAATFGGGICVASGGGGAGADLTLTNNTLIEQNQAVNPNPEFGTKGGGIYFGKGTIRATKVTIRSNSATLGDGMYRVVPGTTLVGLPTYEGGDAEATGEP